MAGTPIIIRVRTKKGMFKLQNLTANSTINDLKKLISDLSGIQYSLIKILKGYPPKILENIFSKIYFKVYLLEYVGFARNLAIIYTIAD